MTGPSQRTAPGRPRTRRAVVAGAGLAVALAYLAGAALSGRQSPLTRRPLLDGLAPPPPYHWVKPPPELASGNRPPASASSTVRLGPGGSEVSAISTGDGQANLVLDSGAIAPSPGQSEVAVTVQPVDPGTLAPAPPGLLLAGNAYRIRFVYRPSGKAVATLAGKVTVALIFPLLATPVTSLFDHTVLVSADGRAWSRQASTTTPGTHQVASAIATPGYVVVAVPPAPPAQASANRTPLLIGLAVVGVLVAIAAVLLARGFAARPQDEDDQDEEDEQYDSDQYDGEETFEDDRNEERDRGTEERR